MTLGMMMSLTYIIGQLNAPINAFISFAQQLQDAKISLERLNEIRTQEDEDDHLSEKLDQLPQGRDLTLEHVYFNYDGAERDYVLEDVSLSIPARKVTAIVGASGSGKATVMKLLLGFYEPNKGQVRIGETPLQLLNPHLWRASGEWGCDAGWFHLL